MPQRFRRITPRANWTWLYASGTAMPGMLALVGLLLATIEGDLTTAWPVLPLAAMAALYGAKLGRGLSANTYALSISYGLSSATVRWDCIESFQWRHNLHNFGQHGKRLWVMLDDGQMCPTPVVIGGVGMGRTDVGLNQATADALVAQLEARRQAAVETVR